MEEIVEGTLIWEPSDDAIADSNLNRYLSWLAEERRLHFPGYPELWRWSVDKLEDFWLSIWDYFQVTASSGPETILANRQMPGAEWFPGAKLNYAENFFDRRWTDRPAIVFKDETGPVIEVSWAEIKWKTAALADSLKDFGVQAGDRVVAYMPNIPETIVALLATASLGAIWSSCSPDFGSRSVLDRFRQIEPKILLAVDGYRYNGKIFDRCQVLRELQEGLPTLTKTILIPLTGSDCVPGGSERTVLWPDLVTKEKQPPSLTFEQVPFNHPLWVLYSSGTTGLPKPIVQGHGGILMEHMKMASLHLDLHPGDRFFWYTSTGWMMWNFLVGGLLSGATIVVYDGSPGYPDLNALWGLAEELGITYFGTSAAFIGACHKAGLRPNMDFNLSRIKALGSTGSPLSADGFGWVYESVNSNLALESVSGGTDLCTAFVGGCRMLPIHAGEIQCAALGANVQAHNEAGQKVVGEVGELVIVDPMPSMPLHFWNDTGNKRYLESYFDMYPGKWRHGDWIKFNERGGCIIYGRSDSTINRQGVRMGTSEIYQAVESLPEIVDSLVIDLEMLGREPHMPLFVVLHEGVELDNSLKEEIRSTIRRDISPRHLPTDIVAIREVPYTLSGKKMEVPVRRILLGQPVHQAVNLGAMRNPASIDFFVHYQTRLDPAAG